MGRNYRRKNRSRVPKEMYYGHSGHTQAFNAPDDLPKTTYKRESKSSKSNHHISFKESILSLTEHANKEHVVK
ncbi:hypothetical protein L1987_01591 [Smallanthus sonchifolius]|uniref:Uncharacterized protein n=1 Tax=Smallanthus sonchifolius TaxID=185202 RepID=A0ACB9K5I9_9ASTR|nr:hypothetical protein L1987_01591 [Smallanthus sonchifolius]